MAILLTGAAGYIGSSTFLALEHLGEELIVLDNFVTGCRSLLPKTASIYEGCIGDKEILNKICSRHDIKTVFHFAGSLIVSESVEDPVKYYKNNVLNSLSLLDSCIENNIKNIIFSSTASVYGNNPKKVMDESSVCAPESPYANSKRVFEIALNDYSRAYGINYIILRYFNVAGADPGLRTGPILRDATHLIKVACQVATGVRKEISIYGDDYLTPDGTCIRDYIHVSDLAQAHLSAYSHLVRSDNQVTEVFNCGYGVGYSVKEVIQFVEKVSGKKIKIKISPRRKGDPVALIANSSKLRAMTGWSPKYNNLEFIVKTALDWEKKVFGIK